MPGQKLRLVQKSAPGLLSVLGVDWPVCDVYIAHTTI